MQTVSWEDEIKLCDGIPYDIDFAQDFSTIYLDGQLLADMPFTSIIEATSNHQTVDEIFDARNHVPCTAESYRRSRELWEQVDKFTKDERKREIKWEKNRKKRQRDYERLQEEIESCEYFLRDR